MRLPYLYFSQLSKIQQSAFTARHINKMASGRPDVFEYDENDFIHETAPWGEKNSVSNSKFDQTLKSRWDVAMKNGYFRYNIDHIITRILPGPKRYVGQLNTLRGTARREPQKITNLNQQFDHSRFNFTQVKLGEIIFDMSNKSHQSSQNNSSMNHVGNNADIVKNNAQEESNGDQDGLFSANGVTNEKETKAGTEKYNVEETDNRDASLVINDSPMEYGHCLLVPRRLSCSPQILTKQAWTMAIETMLLSNQRSLRMGFNSLCAFASVNHLHFHLFYLEYELIADFCPMYHLGGRFYEFTALPCPGFGLQLHGSSVEEMARLAFGISSYLHKNDVAHNAFFCRGTVFNEPRDSPLTTLRLFIWPRKKFIGNKSSEEFNVACIELGGHLPIRQEAGYYNLTEADVDAIIADACLQPYEYEEIRNYVIKFGLEDYTQTHQS